jgi:hypothetical protein
MNPVSKVRMGGWLDLSYLASCVYIHCTACDISHTFQVRVSFARSRCRYLVALIHTLRELITFRHFVKLIICIFIPIEAALFLA